MADTTTLPATNGNHAQVEASETDRRVLALLARTQRVAALRANGWKVELSGGKWAVLSDPEELTERRARAMKVAMVRTVPRAPTSDTGSVSMDADAVIDSGYICVAAFLTSWSLGDPLPTTANFDRLLDLPTRDYAALQSAAEDLKDEAFTDFSPTPEALADQSSPFTSGSA